jgi:hypothetical protein
VAWHSPLAVVTPLSFAPAAALSLSPTGHAVQPPSSSVLLGSPAALVSIFGPVLPSDSSFPVPSAASTAVTATGLCSFRVAFAFMLRHSERMMARCS